MQLKYSATPCFANFFVIAFIPTLFFLAIVAGFLGLLPINVPLHGLLIISFIYLVFLLFIPHNANYSICKVKSSYLKLDNELHIALQNSSLTIESKTKSLLDLDKFLKEYYSDVRNDNFASVAASIFPMLGILGTFLSIALSMPDFSVKDSNALNDEISLLLNGVGSAFYASIFGILLSLIWTYFEKRGISKIEHFLHEIKQEFAPHLWSQEELDIYRYTQYDLKENRFLAALQETFNLDFIQELTQKQLLAFENITQQNLHNFTQLTNKLTTVSDKLTNTLEEMEHGESALSAQNRIEKALVDFTVATRSFEKNTKVFNAHLENSLNRTFDKIDAELGEIVIKLADFASHVALESQEVQNSIAKYHKLVARSVAQSKKETKA